MKTDLFEPATGDGREGGAVLELFERVRRTAALADHCGFQCMWVAEHHFQPHGGVQSRPQLLIADLMARTDTLQFGVGIFQVPFHPAISTAEDIATLSDWALGRFPQGLRPGVLPQRAQRVRDSHGHQRRLLPGQGPAG